MFRRPLYEWIVAVVLFAAGSALAHTGEDHAESGGRTQVLAPGYGELSFTAPAPGSYSLPPLEPAANGDVLASDGSSTTLHALLGDKLVLLGFIYTSCSDVNGCPLSTAVLHKVGRRLREEPELAAQLRLVVLSFDPIRDTPEVMQRYAESFTAGAVEWQFLTTASESDLRPILAGYGQTVQREYDLDGNELGTLSHILRVFLIDRSSRIRNIYSVSFLHPDTLLGDVKTLLMEEGRTEQPPHAVATDPSRFRGSGDRRDGYESADFQTRSLSLAARQGEPADLTARARVAPLGLPALPVPPDNPLTKEKVSLGRKLFYDRRLSLNGTLSCAMCHIPEQGFTSNELATAVGIEGRTVRRNSPTILNAAYQPLLFHDGRESRLEQQIWGPLLAANEMGNPSVGAVLDTIRDAPDYAGLFDAAFPERGLTMDTLGMAIANYERTLVSGGSPFDRWRYGGNESALDADAVRGFRLFTGKAGCDSCHLVTADSALFSDASLHNTGVGFAPSMLEQPRQRILVAPGEVLSVDRAIIAQVSERPPSDLGRYEITQDPDDRWKYRTPTLRNVALTAPYMHDGSLPTLLDVVAFYDRGGVPNDLLDPRIRPLELSDGEMSDLVVFLESLTGSDVDVLVADAFAAPIGEPGEAP